MEDELNPLSDAEVVAAEEFVSCWEHADTAEYPYPVGPFYKLMARYVRHLQRQIAALKAKDSTDGR